MWFQNRRAKFRKKENTKKGPGRPAHNAHPQSCSGEPISSDELVRKEKERREKKLYKQLEKQQKKLAAKGIHIDMETLSQDYETQRAGGKSTLNLEAALAAAAAHAAMNSEEIDVVGGVEDSSTDIEDEQNITKDKSKKMISPFSIESLLAKKVELQQAAAQAAAASIKSEVNTDEENNNPVASSIAAAAASIAAAAAASNQSEAGGHVSPVPTSCSSPMSRSSTPPSPSPPGLRVPIPVLASNNGLPKVGGGQPETPTPIPGSIAATISEQLSLLKPLTACPEKQSPLFPASAAALLNRLEPRLSFSPPPPLLGSGPTPFRLPQIPTSVESNTSNNEASSPPPPSTTSST